MVNMNEHFSINKLLKFALPTILMMIFTSIYGVVDGLFISNVEGDVAFSGINLIMPYIMLLGVFGFMFGTGGAALVSKTYGEGKINQGNKYFTMTIFLLIILGLINSILGFFTITPVSIILKANKEMLPYCNTYGRILSLFVVFFMLQNAFQSYMVVAKKPLLGFIFTIIAGCTNIIGDYLLIYVFKKGVMGAALASGFSQIIGSILPISYLLIFHKKIPLNFTKTKIQFKPMLFAASNGLSEMVSNLSMSIVNMLFNMQLMRYIGQDGVTAFGIIMYTGFIFVGVYFGYSIGIAPLISFQYGANNKKELNSLLKNSLIIYSVLSFIMSTLSIVLSPYLAGIFIKNNPELLSLSAKALRIYSFSYYLAGFNIFISSFFTDLNDGLTSGIISFARAFVFQIIAIYILPLIFKANGLWLSIVFSEILSCSLSLYFLFSKNKHYGYLKSY